MPKKKGSQRDIMRDLARRNDFDPEATVLAYAAAERRGEVRRLKNSTRLDPEAYARALWADGVAKGWLRG